MWWGGAEMEESMTHVELEWRELPDLSEAPSEPGIYAVWDDQYIHGSDVLVYIGQAVDLRARLAGHSEWIGRARNPTVEYAVVKDGIHLTDVESLLIFVLQPVYNQRGKEVAPTDFNLQIYNTGHIRNLLPIIDSSYPWFNRAPKPE